jgi:hypothetical protein
MISPRQHAVYNSPIAEMLIPSPGFSSRASSLLLALCFWLTPLSYGADWSTPEQELAKKITTVTGPGTVALEVVDRASFNKKDVDDISRGLRVHLETLGLRTVKPEQAAATVQVSLSENLQSYVWVAEIHQGAGEFSVVMVTAPRLDEATFAGEPAPLNIRKIPLWSQEERILDVAVLEEGSSPSHLAVLDPDKVALYRFTDGRWQKEQVMEVIHSRPWPRDMRGRLVPRQDHLLDAYLPGVICQSSNRTPISLACRSSDDPWPLSSSFALGGFFAPTRNYFTGVFSPGIGKLSSTGKFYSAAPIPRQNYTLWIFATVDGQIHLLDGITDQTAPWNWGSDLASVKTSCGSGWQILATRPSDNATDSVRAYELPDREPLLASQAVDFAGGVTALWTEAKGSTAIAVSRNAETGNYEAFRLAITCGQ